MSKTIQIRNVPDAIHRRLKVRAARMGMSLSNYLLMEIKEIVGQPTLTEFCERLHKRKPVEEVDTARLLNREREIR